MPAVGRHDHAHAQDRIPPAQRRRIEHRVVVAPYQGAGATARPRVLARVLARGSPAPHGSVPDRHTPILALTQ
ncbi:hypothetical protein ADL05_07230 [Nocardiopsis sp. NRRL B-16309]|nr:hypothetical protein ADL05_07230 [Nocardiopsis sp. NRRL B-16309]